MFTQYQPMYRSVFLNIWVFNFKIICIRIVSEFYPVYLVVLAVEFFFLHSLSLSVATKISEMKSIFFFLSFSILYIISWTFWVKTSGHFEYYLVYLFSLLELKCIIWLQLVQSIYNYRDRRDFSLNFKINIINLWLIFL